MHTYCLTKNKQLPTQITVARRYLNNTQSYNITMTFTQTPSKERRFAPAAASNPFEYPAFFSGASLQQQPSPSLFDQGQATSPLSHLLTLTPSNTQQYRPSQTNVPVAQHGRQSTSPLSHLLAWTPVTHQNGPSNFRSAVQQYQQHHHHHHHQHQQQQKSPQPQYYDHKGTRSQGLKGVANLPRETNLLRRKLDKIVWSFQETVEEHDKNQKIRMDQLKNSNQRLQKHLRELEIENLRYFKELEDAEETIDGLEKNGSSLTKELATLKEQLQSATEDNVIERAHSQILKKENDKLKAENERLKMTIGNMTECVNDNESKSVEDLQHELDGLKLGIQDKENTSNNSTNQIDYCSHSSTARRQSSHDTGLRQKKKGKTNKKKISI
jgi:hypothetical protein